MDLCLPIMFWLACGLLAYTFLGYPAAIHWLGRTRAARATSAPCPRTTTMEIPVSVVLVVRNEEHRVEARIANLLDTTHPATCLEVIVVSDGSTDDTTTKVRNIGRPSVRLIECPDHRGKAACLNDALLAARGEIIVFADARQRFETTTIPALVAAFADHEVGAASGELHIEESSTGVAAGVGAYWKLEKLIRLGESRVDSTVGCTGAIYAIRRELFVPLPADTILDDVVCPMLIVLRGMKVRFCPEAVAIDPQRLEPAAETRRKRRTLAGNFQMLFRYPSWLFPWRNRLFIQLVSHKYLRLVAPILLVTALACSAILARQGSPFFLVMLMSQSAVYILAACGMAFPRATGRCFSFPAAFLFLNLMTVRGFLDYCLSRNKAGW